MTEVLGLVLAVVFGLVLYVIHRRRLEALESLEPPAPPPAPEPAIEPAIPAPVAPPVKLVPRDHVTVRFVTPGGRALGSMTIDRKHRRPTMQYRPKNGKLANFVCASSDGRTFIYRRVSEERE